MNYNPSDALRAHLGEQAVAIPDGGFLLDKTEWAEAEHQFRRDYPSESTIEICDRVAYFLIWKHYGIPKAGQARGLDVTNARRVQALHVGMREMAKVHLPELKQSLEDGNAQIGGGVAAVEQAIRSSASALEADIKVAGDSIASTVGAASLAISNQHSELMNRMLGWEKTAQERHDRLMSSLNTAFHRARQAFLWLVLIGLLLIAATLFAGRAHAQLDGVQVQAGGVSQKQWMGGIARVNFTTGLAVSCSGSPVVCAISASGAPGPGGITETQVNGVDATTQTPINFQDSTCTAVTNPSAGNIKVTFNCQLAKTQVSATHKFLLSYDSTTGNFAAGQASSTDLGDFSTTVPVTSGKIPIFDSTAPNAAGGTGAYVPGDPLVQGTTAEGAAIPNPVVVAGKDGSGNTKAIVVDASGRPTVNVNGSVGVTGPVTDTQLRATPVPVSGTVTASGPVTDTQLRATPVPVSGTVTASGPVTDTQLRATPVPVSGTVTASGPVTDTQLRAAPVPTTAQGAVAESVAQTQAPLATGGTSVTADKTATHNGDAVGFVADTVGKQIVLPYANPENFLSGATTDMTGTTATTIIAGAASTHLYITNFCVQNSHATVSTWVNLTEETSGTILATIYAPALGGGACATLPVPIRVPTAAKAFQATNVTTGANTRAWASGYKAVQ